MSSKKTPLDWIQSQPLFFPTQKLSEGKNHDSINKEQQEEDKKHRKLEAQEKENLAMEKDQNPECTSPIVDKQYQGNPTKMEDESI